jgi:AbrB family looped-hinge helix DNA binding protein
MTTATLTSRGQITIPADVRRSLNIEAGDRVEFVQIEPGRFELIAATRSVRELKLVWVLSSAYGLDRQQVSAALELLLRSKEIVLDRADLVLQAQRKVGTSNADFADCLIERIAGDAGCSATMTFDVGAAKAAGMSLIG